MTFNLFDIVLLLVITLVFFQFWRVRAIAERAKGYLHRYCRENQLQLISIARRKTRLTLHRGKIDWHTEFQFEFSGNGEDSYLGEVIMQGLTITKTILPAYRVN